MLSIHRNGSNKDDGASDDNEEANDVEQLLVLRSWNVDCRAGLRPVAGQIWLVCSLLDLALIVDPTAGELQINERQG